MSCFLSCCGSLSLVTTGETAHTLETSPSCIPFANPPARLKRAAQRRCLSCLGHRGLAACLQRHWVYRVEAMGYQGTSCFPGFQFIDRFQIFLWSLLPISKNYIQQPLSHLSSPMAFFFLNNQTFLNVLTFGNL